MAQLVSKTYAKAFFELALETDSISIYEREALLVIEALRSDEAFVKVLNHPEISETRKITMISNVFEGQISEPFMGLFKLIINKRRETYLFSILEDFLDRVLEHKGMATVEVVSAVELTEEQLTNIKNKLSENLKKQIVLEVRVDPSIIAGLKVIVDGHVIDGSAKTQMADIRNTLYNMKMA